MLGSISGRGYFIEEQLIYYRQHDYQLIGGRKLKVIDKSKKSLSTGISNYLFEKEMYETLNDRVLKLSGKINDKIGDKISFLKQRMKIYESSGFLSLIIITHELFSRRYFKYSNGLESVAKDIFIVFKSLISKKRKENRGGK